VEALSDETLLAAMGAGDADAAAVFVRRFQSRVYGLALTMLRDPGIAEDVAQETFVRAWRHAATYDARRGRVPTWLLTIARNVAVDHFRQRRQHVALDLASELPAEGAADEAAERRSDVEHLGRLLSALPERERELLSLKYGAGLTNRAIARLTGLSESNVGTLLHRTVTALRDEWQRTTEVREPALDTKEHHRG